MDDWPPPRLHDDPDSADGPVVAAEVLCELEDAALPVALLAADPVAAAGAAELALIHQVFDP